MVFGVSPIGPGTLDLLSRFNVRCSVPILLLSLSLFTVGCHSVQVASSTDPHADFSPYHTFNFAKPSPSTNAVQLSELNRQRIQTAITDEMARRSCRLAEQPDLRFVIEFGTSVETYNRADPNVQSGSMGANLSKHYALRNDEALGSQPVVDYTQGTLLIHAMDTKLDRVVWEGVAKGVVYQNRPDDLVEKRIREAVSRVFAEYPIKPGQK